MAITALKLAAVTTYISDLDPAKGQADEAENATKFELGTLDSRIAGFINDKMTKFAVDASTGDNGAAETSVQMSLVNFETVQYGLRGWTNFLDEEGNDIPFKTLSKNVAGKSYRYVHPDVMELIPGAVIKELAEQIKKNNDLSAEAGNA